MNAIQLADWETDPLNLWKGVQRKQILESMGVIPLFIADHDKPAAKQIAEYYIGGWSPMDGWEMLANGCVKYSGDQPLSPAAQLVKLDGEIVRFYPGAWISIQQENGDFEIARID